MIIRSVTFLFCCFGITAGQTTTLITKDEGVCGTRVQDDDVKRIRIVATIPGRVPWHVGIYKYDTTTKMNNLICGGTIISRNVVLTAATCVYDSVSSKTYNPNLFRITAGKIESDWTSTDPNAQNTTVNDIAVPETFLGYIKNNADNLALLRLAVNLRLNDLVQPICFDLDSSMYDIQNNYLQTAGWGLDGGVSKWPYLKEANFQYLNNAECTNKFSNETDFIRFINDDKICVLTPGGREEHDTGGSLVYKKDNKYHLVGVMSDYINNGFSPATNLSNHLTWINKTIELLNKSKRKCKGGFLCLDGSCIHQSLVCDDYIDCPDGSDEKQEICHQLKPANISKSSCLLPTQPVGENYTKQFCNKNCELKGGAYIDQNQQVQLTCSEGFATKETGLNAVYVCSQGRWFPGDPECIKLCSRLKEPNANFHCTYKGEDVNCETLMRPGTIASYKCNKYYKLVGPSAFRNNLTCIEGGIWKDPLPECDQECGIENPAGSVELTAVNYNENITEHGKYPWHVGIFTRLGSNERLDNYCAGTLINEKVVLTATSCMIGPAKIELHIRVNDTLLNVTDAKGVNISLSGDEVMVVAGKFYRNLDTQEEHQQTSRVSNVLMQVDNLNYQTIFEQNIALLITKNSFKFSDFVLPVCIDYSQRFDVLKPNTSGTIVGWGTIEEGESTNELREVQVPILNTLECRNKYSLYIYFIKSDKICLPYINGSGPQTPGAGLTIKQQGRHFLYGVNIINAKGVTDYIFSIVTNVSSHIEWIKGAVNISST